MITATTVLVVDSDARSQRLLESSLAAAGYECLRAATAAEALKLIATRPPDLVILDSHLPDLDGGELIRKVRRWSDVPIIVLAARRRVADEIATLDLGADDYVGRPFRPDGLLARIRNALRHRPGSRVEAAVFSSGGLVVDTLGRTVRRQDEPVRLTAREFDLLAFLVRHAGRVVTHRQILEAVWDSAHAGHTQYLRVFVGRLRQKIEANPAKPRLLTTVQGVGYRLAAL
jgi:two-component system KDP operon response regulator KdpE